MKTGKIYLKAELVVNMSKARPLAAERAFSALI
jgi:hypothetical protein